MEMSFPLPNQM